jgi:hypothetical protein
MSRPSRLPILMLILMSQVMLISSMNQHGAGSVSIDHDNMLEHFKPCQAHWIPRGYVNLQEEKYWCDSDTEDVDRGVVYFSGDEKEWVSYAWGLPSKKFPTKEAAKNYIETGMAYWLRPKAKWWQFGKEFAEGETKQ